LRIALPAADTEQGRQAYENMKKTFAFNPRADLEI